MASKQALGRLRKELKAICEDPPPHIHVSVDEANVLNWNYLLEGPKDTPYEGGWYWGKLRFPKDYPYKPPSILMMTPSGRFESNTRLCLSMSDFHPETWQPAWSVATVLKGLLSFMCEESPTAGAVDPPPPLEERRKLARASMEWNKAQRDFTLAFPEVDQILEAAQSRDQASAAQAETAAEGEEASDELVPGATVRLSGLKAKPELNGQEGVVQPPDQTARPGRYTVSVNGSMLSIKRENLQRVEGAGPPKEEEPSTAE